MGSVLPAGPSIVAADRDQALQARRGREVQRLAATGTLNLVGVTAGGALNLAVTVIITRGFGLGRAGLLLEGISLYGIVRTSGTLGGDTGLLRELPRLVALRRRAEISRTVLAALVPVVLVSALVAGLGLVWAGSLARLLDHGRQASAEEVLYVRLIFSSLFLASPALVILAAVRALGRQRSYVLLENLVKPFLRTAGAALVVVIGAGQGALGLSYVLPVLVGLFGGIVVLVRLVPPAARRQAGPTVLAVMRRFWAFAAPRGLAVAFAAVVAYVDVLFVGAIRGPREATVYAAVSRLVMTATFGLHAVRVAIGPQFSRLLTEHRHRDAEHVYQTATSWLILMSWPVYLMLANYPALALQLFGAHYAAGALALTILCCTELVDMGVGNVTLYLLMGGKSSWNLFNTGVALLLNITVNLLLIPHLGFVGAAIAWSLSIATENLLALVEVWLLLGVRPFGRSWLPTATAALACFGVLPLFTRIVFGAHSKVGIALALAVALPCYAVLSFRRREELQLPLLKSAVAQRHRRGQVGPDSAARRG